MARRLPILLPILLSIPCVALADDAAMQGAGGALQPMEEHPSIVMDRMDVEIDVFPSEGYGKADCRFLFRNTGGATTVRMGFPESGWNGGPENPRGFTSFATSVDGKRVPTTIEGLRASEPEGGWRRWRVKRVRFAAGQRRTVRVRYGSAMGEDSLGGRFFPYEVRTGASWKGPIGFARVCVRAHYRPGEWTFTARPESGKLRPYSFEWLGRNVEPAAHEAVSAAFRPVWLRVFLGEGVQEVPVSRGAEVRGGSVQFGLLSLADWLLADVSRDWPRVTLTRGGRSVQLYGTEPWMEANGVRTALPFAPAVKRGRLQVPLRALATALGAEVAYDPGSRTVRVTFPLLEAIQDALGPDEARSRWHCLQDSATRGYGLPEEGDYRTDVLDRARTMGIARPWMAAGDLHGSDRTDLAVLVRKGDRWGIAALHSGGQCFLWVREPARQDLAEGRLSVVLKTRPPGTVEYWQESETAPTPSQLSLHRDGIEVIGENTAVLYYWAGGGYRHVLTRG